MFKLLICKLQLSFFEATASQVGVRDLSRNISSFFFEAFNNSNQLQFFSLRLRGMQYMTCISHLSPKFTP
jgi:hypothetical protein